MNCGYEADFGLTAAYSHFWTAPLSSLGLSVLEIGAGHLWLIDYKLLEAQTTLATSGPLPYK